MAVSEKAWPVIEANAAPRFYFDFASYRKKMTGDSAQTPYTPAVSALVAQNKAIEMIREEGLENVFERHRVLVARRQGGHEGASASSSSVPTTRRPTP